MERWLRVFALSCLLAVTVHAGLARAQLDAPGPAGPADDPAEPVYTRTLDHGLWHDVLATHVNDRGELDYARLLDSPGDLQRLDDYLAWLHTADLSGTSPHERIAFWINAYNALAVRAALDHYPLDSVRAIEAFFIRDRQVVAGNSVSLNEIENDLLRYAFPNEPRVHFALSTLSRGSPALRPEAYTGERLEAQLEEQARRYVLETTTIRPNAMEIELGPMFDWFGRDFAPVGGVRAFVAALLPGDSAAQLRNEALVLVYGDFDWRLNDVSER
jgi:hypothetical protein